MGVLNVMITLIGLSGSIQSGKDTVAGILAEEFGYFQVSVGSFIRAEILDYQMTSDVRKLTHDSIIRSLEALNPYKLRQKPTPNSVRLTLQWYGHLRYRENHNYWLDKVDAAIQNCGHSFVVFSDVRMNPEFRYCQERGQAWRLLRVNAKPQIESDPIIGSPYTLSQHITETAISNHPFDQYVANNSDIVTLRKNVRMLVTGLELTDTQGDLFK